MIDEIDHSGEVHGRLTLLSKGERYISTSGKSSCDSYYCSCSCGKYTADNPKLIKYPHIKNGSIKSCGCLKNELTSKRSKKYNTYDLSGGYGVGYTTKGDEFYFDLDDYNKIKDYCWYIGKDGYVRTNLHNKNTTLLFHRLVLPNAIQVDHINHMKNDNRKSNIRMCNESENQHNKGISKNNTSGVTGVGWNKQKNKWRARITINNKEINLGFFSAFDDAVAARKAAEEKYFGKYSYDNSMKERNNVFVS